MTRIAFFAHDAADAAVRRRVESFINDGLDVTAFTMRRSGVTPVGCEQIDLGRTYDGAFAQRVSAIVRGARLAVTRRERLSSADIIYARNLDMLATAFLARRLAHLRTPVIYEALDVHRLLTREDPIGWAFRRIEGSLLGQTSRLVVSSPAFLSHHFNRRYPNTFRACLIENRLTAGGKYAPRSGARPPLPEPLRIGWIGVLRCRRSLDLLTRTAREFSRAVHIDLHGVPSLKEIPDFHARLSGLSNVTYHGRYRSPEDLSQVYSNLHVVWAGDFMEAGFNSSWLLPNRLYEGGYFGVPSVAPAGTQTGQWITSHGAGFELKEDLAQTLPGLVRQLLKNPDVILTHRKRLLTLPQETFVARNGELADMVEKTLLELPSVTLSSPKKAKTPNPRFGHR